MTTSAATRPATELTRRWMEQGTSVFLSAVEGLHDDGLDARTTLDGWSRRQLIGHVAANADALGRLVRWASTGEETRMYTSPEQRHEDIEKGARLPAEELRTWLTTSAQQLASGLDSLSADAWSHEVVTAQGRAVPATEIPWMRSREAMVHTVDLRCGVAFADLPADFLHVLVADVVAKRSTGGTGPALLVLSTDTGASWEIEGTGEPVSVHGTLADVATWLSGRPGADVETQHGIPVPELPAWL